MKRRGFLRKSVVATLLIALHQEACIINPNASDKEKVKEPESNNLIKNIRLMTSRPLQEMIIFYSAKLGMRIISKTEQEVTFFAGGSTLTFVKVNSNLNPWYHFAFNIPENKILQARDWQLKRSELLTTPHRLRDNKYPDDIRHFPNWNAHAIFFWDPAGNIVEYIARHNLNNKKEGDFNSKDILNISEIGFVVDDQEKEATKIHEELGLPAYPKATDSWWSMGDENGLLLCLPKKIIGELEDNPKRFEVFETQATINATANSIYQFQKFPYKVISTKKI